VLRIIDSHISKLLRVVTRTKLKRFTVVDGNGELSMRSAITNFQVKGANLDTISAERASMAFVLRKMEVVVLALTIWSLPQSNVDVSVTTDLESSEPSVVASDELLLGFFSPGVPLRVVWGVEISIDVKVVLKHCISPAATHAKSGIVMTLRVIYLWVCVSRVSVRVIAGTPTVVLEGEILEVFTCFPTGIPIVSILLWSEIKVSVTIISETALVAPVLVLFIEIVAVDSIRPSTTHAFSF
jgi:hypothetical protein